MRAEGALLALGAIALLAGAVAIARRPRSWLRHAPLALVGLAVVAFMAAIGWLVTHLFHGASTAAPPKVPASAATVPYGGTISAQPHHAAALGAAPVVGGSLAAALLIVAVAAAVLAWRRKSKTEADVAGDPRDAVYAAVDAGAEAMRDVLDPRAAIVACYAAMQRTLAKAAGRRRIAETPGDLLAHAAALGHAPQAAARLTELFLEARYSTDAMTPQDREAAGAALAELRESDVAAGEAATPAPVIDR